MNLREYKTIFSSDVQYSEPIFVDIVKADELKIQVTGEGSCDIEILGKIFPSSDYIPVTILQDSDYTFTDKIIKSGFYTISVEGISKIKINVASYEDGMNAYLVTGGWSE